MDISSLLSVRVWSILQNKKIYQLGDDSHLYRDATEKVLILRKVAQDKVYLYVLRYYILYAKTVFQWRPIDGEKQAGISGGSQSPS